MKRLISIALFVVGLGLSATFGQSPPPLFNTHDETAGQCNSLNSGGSGGTEVACDGSLTRSWKIFWPQNGECASGPVLSSGPNSGYAIKQCATRQDMTFYRVQYDSYGKQVVSTTLLATYTNEAWAAAVGFFGCQASTGGFQSDCGVETDVVFNPFIGSSGAFVLAFQAWSGSSHPTKNQPILMISQSADPSDVTKWNTYAPFDTTPNDVNTNVAPRLQFDWNGLCLSAANTQLDATNTTSVWWCWGRDHFPTMNDVSYAGINNLPLPDLTIGLSFGTASQRPSYVLASSRDYTVSKSITKPMTTVSVCDFSIIGVPSNCQNGSNRQISATMNYITWSDGHTAAFSKQSITTSKFFNAAGSNCIRQGVGSFTGPPDIIEPNQMNHRGTNNTRASLMVEDPSQIIYFPIPGGCSTSNGTNGFWTAAIDVSTPASPSINTSLSGYATMTGGGAAGTLDASFPGVTLDPYGNVLYSYVAASTARFTSPGVLYKPVGSNTLAGPYYPDTYSGTAAISTSGANCSPSTNCASYTFTTTPANVGLIIPAATGTFQFEDSTGSALTCTLAGSSPATTATSVTNPTTTTGAWGCPTTGKTGIRVRQSSGSASVTVYFQEKYWASRATTSCDQQGNITSPTVDPDIVGVFANTVRDGQNPYNIWFDNTAGLTNTACSWQMEGYNFIVHAPVNAASIVVLPSTATIAVLGTQAMTDSTTFTDGSTTACSTGTWLSSSPGVASINAASGIVTGVAAGSTNISLVCNGTTSATPAVITVPPAVQGYFPAH